MKSPEDEEAQLGAAGGADHAGAGVGGGGVAAVVVVVALVVVVVAGGLVVVVDGRQLLGPLGHPVHVGLGVGLRALLDPGLQLVDPVLGDAVAASSEVSTSSGSICRPPVALEDGDPVASLTQARLAVPLDRGYHTGGQPQQQQHEQEHVAG